MLLQVAFHIMILICFIHTPAESAAPITISPHCNSTCGSVSTPYPFGMNDPTCHAGKGFEIQCNITNWNGNLKASKRARVISVALR
ncbi:hypothetical protein S83_011552 [Arachis hypogaea]